MTADGRSLEYGSVSEAKELTCVNKDRKHDCSLVKRPFPRKKRLSLALREGEDEEETSRSTSKRRTHKFGRTLSLFCRPAEPTTFSNAERFDEIKRIVRRMP